MSEILNKIEAVLEGEKKAKERLDELKLVDRKSEVSGVLPFILFGNSPLGDLAGVGTGAAVGSLFGPVGAIIGAFISEIGGTLGSLAALSYYRQTTDPKTVLKDKAQTLKKYEKELREDPENPENIFNYMHTKLEIEITLDFIKYQESLRKEARGLRHDPTEKLQFKAVPHNKGLIARMLRSLALLFVSGISGTVVWSAAKNINSQIKDIEGHIRYYEKQWKEAKDPFKRDFYEFQSKTLSYNKKLLEKYGNGLKDIAHKMKAVDDSVEDEEDYDGYDSNEVMDTSGPQALHRPEQF